MSLRTLDKDSKSIIYSYLPIEYILIIYKNNHKIRDQLVKLHKISKINFLIKDGHIETLRYLANTGTQFKLYDLDLAVNYGDLEIVKFFMFLGIEPSKDTIQVATSNGYLNILKYWHTIGIVLVPIVKMHAVTVGHLHIIKYLVELRCEFDKYDFYNAIRNGHLDVIIYFVSINLIVTDEGSINLAIENGKLTIVQYLVSLGITPTRETMKLAITSDHIEIVEYLSTYIKLINSWLLIAMGSEKMLKYLLSKGLVPDGKFDKLIKNRYNDMPEYLKEIFPRS